MDKIREALENCRHMLENFKQFYPDDTIVVGWINESLDEIDDALTALPSCEGWIPTTERLPEKHGKSNYEYVECLIFYKGEILMRPWNCEHQVWDDEEHDDFFCEPTAPTHWRPLPSPPER